VNLAELSFCFLQIYRRVHESVGYSILGFVKNIRTHKFPSYRTSNGVATTSRLLKIIGLFCKRAL